MTHPTSPSAAAGMVPATAELQLRHRVTAWLSFKFGKRPSDALLEYCAEWATTPSLRQEAARLLAKRKARHE